MRQAQIVLVTSVLLGSWLGMQAVHELGHVLCAWLTGAKVARVVVDPFTFSRTDAAGGHLPVLVVWAGPLLGVLLPLLAWLMSSRAGWPGSYLLRFFAGFCLIADGCYLAIGSFERAGDPGDMLRLGSPAWFLWAFAVVTVPTGFALWHHLGTSFGLGPARGQVSRRAAYSCLAAVVIWTAGTAFVYRCLHVGD